MLKTVFVLAALCAVSVSPAKACTETGTVTRPSCMGQDNNPFSGAISIRVTMHRVRHSANPQPALSQETASWQRPRAWCGWWLRTYLGVSNPAGNLARWWVSYGMQAQGPEVGAIVVWPHHVGIITGGSPGQWVIKSGNDGHAVRERVRSVANAIAFRLPG